MPSFTDRLRWWSYRRQLLGRAASDPLTALKDVVAVYATQPTAILSLGARVMNFDAATFRAFDERRAAIRLPAMRTSGFLVPSASAHLVFSATDQGLEKQSWRLREARISASTFQRKKARLLKQVREPTSARDLKAALGWDDGSLTPVLQMMSFAGEILSVAPNSTRSNAWLYVDASAWLGHEIPEAGQTKARAWLASRYLEAFGPARVEDFRWWAGLTEDQAQHALGQIATEDLGDGYLIAEADLDAFEEVERPSSSALDVLPKWDCYTMGYPSGGRSRLASQDAQDQMYDRDGNALGTVLSRGEVIGVWSARTKRSHWVIDLNMFERPGPRLRARIEKALGEIASLVELEAVEFR